MRAPSAAGASGNGMRAPSAAGASGSGMRAPSAAGASDSGMCAPSAAGASGSGLRAPSAAGASGSGMRAPSTAGASGSGMRAPSAAGASGSGMRAPSAAGASGSGMRAPSAAGASGSGMRAPSAAGASGSGIGSRQRESEAAFYNRQRQRSSLRQPVHAPPSYTFPSRLPDVVLTPEQQQEKYGIPRSSVPSNVRAELDVFCRYQSDAINLDRGARYTRAVQSTTSDKHETIILGYLGYVRTYFAVPTLQLGLCAYADPTQIAQFVAYLRARGVSKFQLLKHVSLARKVNDFLKSGPMATHEQVTHAAKMDTWLGTLEAQLNSAIPAPRRDAMPEATKVWLWVRRLVDDALRSVDADILTYGNITYRTAVDVQRALIACFVTGMYIPPCRLSLLKTWVHPRYNGRIPCTDPDCMFDECGGNQLQVLQEEDPEELAANDQVRGMGCWGCDACMCVTILGCGHVFR